MAGDRTVDIAERFQADAEIDVRLGVVRGPRDGLPVQLAGLAKLARAFEPIAFVDQPVGGVGSLC